VKTFALIFLLALPVAAQKEGPKVSSGIDVLIENGFEQLKNKNVGLITNQTGVDAKGRSTVQAFANAHGVRLRALFAPEHGFAGTSEENVISDGTYFLPDGRRIPLHSLYGSTKAPTADMLRGLDTLVFDIQDIGARFYTYATTMAMAMEAAAKADLDFLVLDRPNPITGDHVEGTTLDKDIRHFTAYHPVPVRHGMTMGELARHFNIRARIGARLQVIGLRGWERDMWFEDTGLPWIRPSPNMPDVSAATLYPGIGCFEAANVSVGRGTKIPFRWIGAPWMDAKKIVKKMRAAGLQGVTFDAKSFTPSKSVFKGRKSRGIRMKIVDRSKIKPLHIFAHLAAALRDTHPKEFVLRRRDIARMTGSERFPELFSTGAAAGKLIELFEADSEKFIAERAAYLLY
jgi:uncharacterized protein YbbC (DUF1343 family)